MGLVEFRIMVPQKDSGGSYERAGPRGQSSSYRNTVNVHSKNAKTALIMHVCNVSKVAKEHPGENKSLLLFLCQLMLHSEDQNKVGPVSGSGLGSGSGSAGGVNQSPHKETRTNGFKKKSPG